MDEIILGLSLTATIVFLFKLIYGWFKYSRSIHKLIYSSYLEYYVKKNKIRKLSESTVFEEDFGKHRVLFQLFSNNGQKSLQPYIIVILSSGMYCLKISNAPGEVYGKRIGTWQSLVAINKKHPEKKVIRKMNNPIVEIELFNKKVQEKITKLKTPVYKIAVFPDQCILKIESKEMIGTLVVKYSQLRDTLRNIHQSKEKALNDWEIDALWEMVAENSLKLEEK
ncbi:NERD domain-containing protein [Desnuesiella massiliensis]|uniref:NERD domain-containing protein n=1 Tax=Desnuesiella massiliensis TaxID=1650662 RepID=UPI0006E1F4EA|nr:NERD domain-containing protein [Desnuesiella massiliensis]